MGFSSLLHLLILAELIPSGPERNIDDWLVVFTAPLVGKGHICLISKTAQKSGTKTYDYVVLCAQIQ